MQEPQGLLLSWADSPSEIEHSQAIICN